MAAKSGNINFRVDKGLRDTLEKLARQSKRSLADYVRSVLEEHVKEAERVLFFSKFAVMLSNGIPIEKVLSILDSESNVDSHRQAARKMKKNFASGKPLVHGIR